MRYVGDDERGSLRRHPHRLKHNLKSLLSSHYSVNSRLPQLLPSCGPLSLSCCAATQSAKPLHPSILHRSPFFSLFNSISLMFDFSLSILLGSSTSSLPPSPVLPLLLDWSESWLISCWLWDKPATKRYRRKGSHCIVNTMADTANMCCLEETRT